MKDLHGLAELRFQIRDSMDDGMIEIEDNISDLAVSCGDWAKKNATGMKLGQTACSIFRHLMYAPGIFAEPANYRFGEIADLAACGETTVRVGIGQLESFGLVQDWPGRTPRRLQLCAPDDDLIAWHDARMARLYGDGPWSRSMVPFEQALPIWTAFTARFSSASPLA